jgi:hypothetical protein
MNMYQSAYFLKTIHPIRTSLESAPRDLELKKLIITRMVHGVRDKLSIINGLVIELYSASFANVYLQIYISFRGDMGV